jgi:hypothetical protein
MGEQTLNRMKKIVSILLAVFLVSTLTAVSASACDNEDKCGDEDHTSRSCGDHYGSCDDQCGNSYDNYGYGYGDYDGCDDQCGNSYDNYEDCDGYGHGDYDDCDDEEYDDDECDDDDYDDEEYEDCR